jgi:leucyl aminopeptidase
MIITLKTQVPPAGDLVIPVLQSDALAGELAGLAQQLGLPAAVLERDYKADLNEVLPVYNASGQRTYLLGLGKEPQSADWLRSFRKFFFSAKSRLPNELGVDVSGFSADVVEAVVLGILGGGYDLQLYKTDKSAESAFYGDEGQLTLYVDADQQSAAEDALARGRTIAQTQLTMLDLMNAPANYKNPQTLADWAVNAGRTNGYSVTILDKAALEEQQLGALLSVSQGSDVPPVLIVAEYKPAGVGNLRTVGLVGKGVTFDTGGVSIKSSASMHLMKSDMGGAAAVLGTIDVAAKLNLPIHLIGVVPATENSTDGSSTKPGDVITAYNGKTIEIIDTDAEGRVILADGLGYLLRHYQPEVVIDLATLTGSIIAALGYHAAGLFTANDELAAQLAHAGERTGERVWRMPLWDVYKEDIKSDVADVKNFSGKPLAGSISAAKFLEFFSENHPAWAHLDIAGMAFADTEFGSQKNATGFGIRLLIDYICNMA